MDREQFPLPNRKQTNNDDNYLGIEMEVLLHFTGQGTHILITGLHSTSVHAFIHKNQQQKQNKQTNIEKTANSMLKSFRFHLVK